MSKHTCGQCHHFLQYVGEQNGQCYYNPPVPTKDGSNIRPTIKVLTPACSKIDLMAADEAPAIKTKEHVPSHGLVAKKDAPKGKRGFTPPPIQPPTP